jgi:RHS repeat-associated protein
MTSRGGASNTISWASYDLPISIKYGTQTDEFSYGVDRARYKQVRKTNTTVDATILYVGGLLERETTPSADTWRHFVSVGGRTVAKVERVNTTNTTQYLHRDQQSGVVEITSDAGALVQSFAYDSWGLRRNPSTWAALGSPFSGAPSFKRGYTDHEHLDNVELVHMNGRVQDPRLGVFLSADPLVQAPYHSQSFNRYAYAWDNPLTLIDPSGFQTDIPDIPGTCPQLAPGIWCTTNPFPPFPATPVVDPTAPTDPALGAATAGSFGGPTGGGFIGSVGSAALRTPQGREAMVVAGAATAVAVGVIIATQPAGLRALRRPEPMPARILILPDAVMSGLPDDEKQAQNALSADLGGTPANPDPDEDPDWKDEIEELVASANRPINESGLSRAAQKLSSHAQRGGGTFPNPTGGVSEQNALAERVLREILQSPSASRTPLSRGGFDVRLPNGQGIRFNAGNEFDTFLDPKL